jgi:hypothetical protein
MEGTIVVSPGLPEVAPKANVRLGWYLEDARHFLRKEGTYVAWIEQTCPLFIRAHHAPAPAIEALLQG